MLLRNQDQTQSNLVLLSDKHGCGSSLRVNMHISWINLKFKKSPGKLKQDKNAYFSYKVSLMSKECINFRRLVQRLQSLP